MSERITWYESPEPSTSDSLMSLFDALLPNLQPLDLRIHFPRRRGVSWTGTKNLIVGRGRSTINQVGRARLYFSALTESPHYRRTMTIHPKLLQPKDDASKIQRWSFMGRWIDQLVDLTLLDDGSTSPTGRS